MPFTSPLASPRGPSPRALFRHLCLALAAALALATGCSGASTDPNYLTLGCNTHPWLKGVALAGEGDRGNVTFITAPQPAVVFERSNPRPDGIRDAIFAAGLTVAIGAYPFGGGTDDESDPCEGVRLKRSTDEIDPAALAAQLDPDSADCVLAFTMPALAEAAPDVPANDAANDAANDVANGGADDDAPDSSPNRHALLDAVAADETEFDTIALRLRDATQLRVVAQLFRGPDADRFAEDAYAGDIYLAPTAGFDHLTLLKGDVVIFTIYPADAENLPLVGPITGMLTFDGDGAPPPSAATLDRASSLVTSGFVHPYVFSEVGSFTALATVTAPATSTTRAADITPTAFTISVAE